MTSTYFFALMLLNLNYDNLPNADTFSQFLLVSIILLTILVNLCIFLIKIRRKLLLLRNRWLVSRASKKYSVTADDGDYVEKKCEVEGETIIMKSRKI
jgi:hypothetical protein